MIYRLCYPALSKEPLETDEDSFMRRFITTQVRIVFIVINCRINRLCLQIVNEMFGDAYDAGDPNSFDNDVEEEGVEDAVYLSQTADSTPDDKNSSRAPFARDFANPSPLQTQMDAALRQEVAAQNEEGSASNSGRGSSQQFSSFMGTVGKAAGKAAAASKSLNINSNLRSLSIQTSSGLGLAVDNLGAQIRPHSMRSTLSSMSNVGSNTFASISTKSSNLMNKMGTAAAAAAASSKRGRTRSLDRSKLDDVPSATGNEVVSSSPINEAGDSKEATEPWIDVLGETEAPDSLVVSPDGSATTDLLGLACHSAEDEHPDVQVLLSSVSKE
jgi:hypothetical protein